MKGPFPLLLAFCGLAAVAFVVCTGLAWLVTPWDPDTRIAIGTGAGVTVGAVIAAWGGTELERSKRPPRDAELSVRDVPVVTSPRAILRQLPPPPGRFVGRDADLARLTSAFDEAATESTMAVCTIGGIGGIGKTSLALHWAHTHLERFPDGQLFINLRGFDPSGEPMTSAAALRELLTAMDEEAASLPDSLDALSGRFRSAVSGRRILLVLDNARDPAHLVPLLPGSPTCGVLITSRHQLGVLAARHDAQPLSLDVLNDDDARELLSRRLGEARLNDDPRAVQAVVVRCAGLPLALSMVAGRAALAPELPISTIAAELLSSADPLSAFDLDGLDPMASLHTVFSWSYSALPSALREALMLLAGSPCPTASVEIIAALTGTSTEQAAAAVRTLESSSLMHRSGSGRYQLHDLVRSDAATRALTELDQPVRDAAMRRLIDFCTHTSQAAGNTLELTPSKKPIVLEDAVEGSSPLRFDDVNSALAWFDAERAVLIEVQKVALDHGRPVDAFNLAFFTTDYLLRRGYLHEFVAFWQRASDGANWSEDAAKIQLAHRYLGDAYARIGRHTEALAELESALALARESGILVNEANIQTSLARTWELEEDYAQALVHSEAALAIFKELPVAPIWLAVAHNIVGFHQAHVGQFDEARGHCTEALRITRAEQDVELEALILDSLGYIELSLGRPAEAIVQYETAIAIFHQLGIVPEEANTSANLADAYLAVGDQPKAVECRREAARLWLTLGDPEALKQAEKQLSLIDTLDSMDLA